MKHKAVESLGSPLVLVMGGKVVCRVDPCGSSDSWISVRLHKPDFDRLIFPLLEPAHQLSDSHRYVMFHFGMHSGVYLENNLNSKASEEKVDDLFGEALLVNESQLHWGRVPDTFKEVEGYRSKWIPVDYDETQSALGDQA